MFGILVGDRRVFFEDEQTIRFAVSGDIPPGPQKKVNTRVPIHVLHGSGYIFVAVIGFLTIKVGANVVFGELRAAEGIVELEAE